LMWKRKKTLNDNDKQFYTITVLQVYRFTGLQVCKDTFTISGFEYSCNKHVCLRDVQTHL
jgi:hypothetical protein